MSTKEEYENLMRAIQDLREDISRVEDKLSTVEKSVLQLQIHVLGDGGKGICQRLDGLEKSFYRFKEETKIWKATLSMGIQGKKARLAFWGLVVSAFITGIAGVITGIIATFSTRSFW